MWRNDDIEITLQRRTWCFIRHQASIELDLTDPRKPNHLHLFTKSTGEMIEISLSYEICLALFIRTRAIPMFIRPLQRTPPMGNPASTTAHVLLYVARFVVR